MEVVQSAGFAVQSLQDTRFSIGFVGLFWVSQMFITGDLGSQGLWSLRACKV